MAPHGLLTERLTIPAFAAAGAAAGAGLTMLAYALGPPMPIVAVVAFAGLWVGISRPMLALHLGIAAIPLELLSLPIGKAAALSPAEAMFALAGVGYGIRKFVAGELPRMRGLGAPLVVILVALAGGFAVAVEPFEIRKILVMWAAFVLLAALVVEEADAQTVRRLLTTLAFSGIAVAAFAMITSGGEAPELVAGGALAEGRVSGSFEHPNILATVLAFALPAVLALAVAGPAGLRPVMAVGFLIGLSGLVLALSRGGILGIGAAMLVMLWWAPVRRVAAGALALLAVLAAVGANPLAGQIDLVTQRVESVRHTSTATHDYRREIWAAAINIGTDAPLTGVGEKNFSNHYPLYGPLDQGSSFDHAHSVPLTFLAELGLPGLAALVWLMMVVALALLRAMRRRPPDERALVFAVAAGLVAFGVQAMVDYTLRATIIAALLFTFMGMAAALGRPDSEATRVP